MFLGQSNSYFNVFVAIVLEAVESVADVGVLEVGEKTAESAGGPDAFPLIRPRRESLLDEGVLKHGHHVHAPLRIVEHLGELDSGQTVDRKPELNVVLGVLPVRLKLGIRNTKPFEPTKT